MNEVINLNEMPKVFGLCQLTECPYAKTCLRQLVYPEICKRQEPFISIINPQWAAKQSAPCNYYLKNEKVRRARGFTRTTRAIPSGSIASFRTAVMRHMGYKRYYQGHRGEILLKPEEEKIIKELAIRYGVQLDNYFDSYEYVYFWG